MRKFIKPALITLAIVLLFACTVDIQSCDSATGYLADACRASGH